MHAEGFEIGAEDEEEAAEESALNDRARDGSKRIDCLGAQGGGALEADEAEEREYHAKPHAGGTDAAQMELAGVDVQAIVYEQQNQHDGDQRDRDGLDPEHEAGGDLNGAIGEGGGGHH